MKPAFFIVITASDNFRFAHRATARAFCAACKLAGCPAILKSIFQGFIMKQYQAYATGCRVTSNTPKQAALMFFERFPTKRKCNIIEGETDGHFFTVTYGRSSLGQWPYSAKDITKKLISELPNQRTIKRVSRYPKNRTQLGLACNGLALFALGLVARV